MATIYEVATTGSDTSGNGTLAAPWASLYKASQMVTTSGDTIHLGAGTFVETHVCAISVGVNILGSGISATTVTGTYAITDAPTNDQNGATIVLSSTSTGTNGNQSISYFTLEGNSLAGSRAISVKNRSNVIIHHMTIKDFFIGGVSFWTSNGWAFTWPSVAVRETGNQLYSCTIDNCGDQDTTWYGSGLILMTCQEDLLIHDNLLYSNKRTGDHNGNIINAGGGNFLNCKFYNNHSYKPDPGLYSGYNFHLEVWDNYGGFEIYNNTFTGGGIAIDCAGFDSDVLGGTEYSWSIHNNTFDTNDVNLMPSVNNAGYAIHLENHFTKKTLIYNNTFSRQHTAVNHISAQGDNIYIYDNTILTCIYLFTSNYRNWNEPTVTYHLNNLNIYRNKFYSARTSGTAYYGSIYLQTSGYTVSGLNVYNNTMVTSNLFNQRAIELHVGSTMSNVNIKNNIFQYFKNGEPIRVENSSTFTGLHIENNLIYNSNSYNVMPTFTGTAVTDYTFTGNIPQTNPATLVALFMSESTQDYNLQSGSPCINAGQDVGLPYVGAAPDMGYVEFAQYITAASLIINNNKIVKF